jgi:aspartate/methionine/tyrosine aminotransferase
MSVAELLTFESGAAERFQEVWLGYTESPGGLPLRKAIADLYDTIDPDQVLVHSGAEEAIFVFMHAFLQAGDHVIVHWPCYQSLTEIARSIGCDVSLWRAHEENQWGLDLDELKGLIRPNTKLLVVNTPHNPTGHLMGGSEYQTLVRLAMERNIFIFSDEVYRESEYDVAARLQAACDLNERSVSLGVTSKTYGLAGLRIGWIATRDPAVYERMAELKDYTTICNSAPSEFLAGLAMRYHDKLADRNMGIIRANLKVMDGFFERHAGDFTWVRPSAGSMGFPKYMRGDVELLCQELVQDAGILLLPGTLYGDMGNHFRLGLGRKNLPEAVDRWEEFLEKLN